MERTWSSTFILLLLCGCHKVDAMDVDHAVYNWRREHVLNLSRHDPCYNLRAMLGVAQVCNAARESCRFAHENFRGLTDSEQRSCPNAADPDCRPVGFLQMPRCTFRCDVEVPWRRIRGRMQRVNDIEQRELTLRRIAKTVSPPILPPDYAPNIPQRRRIAGPPSP